MEDKFVPVTIYSLYKCNVFHRKIVNTGFLS